jgi:two-component system, sensor histidine kinase
MTVDTPTLPEPLRVLVVDDHADCREMMATMIEMSGYEVISATNGQEALVAASLHEPFAIVTDIGMPVMDGFDLERAIRAHPVLAGTYVIAVSGWSQEQSVAKSALARFDRRLVKPAGWTDLEEALNEARTRINATQDSTS